uniref:Cytochrome c oxidase subunit 2 n=1 Tax=Eustenogaster scitula TaxID=1980568 RepID=A0A509ZRN9_9HYME|nr:cytochrome c oxidase subunit II [Eustenogaster scitula]ARO89840.1 cytochrome c oxidase subunit II [Eustenogaster scitula]
MCSWMMISPQDSNSPIMDLLIFFHDSSMLFIIMIMFFIFYIFVMITNMGGSHSCCITHGHFLEIIWTSVPIIIIMFIIIPSLKILYLSDEMINPLITIKSVGHQWYWSYEYNDFKSIEFDSYMINDMKMNSFRLLDVDNRVILPYNIPIRMLTTSTDVIHSWTVPSLGVKIDAVPGRINQILLILNRPGLYFGQCSEICGTNHSFMPIVLEATSMKKYLNWISSY